MNLQIHAEEARPFSHYIQRRQPHLTKACVLGLGPDGHLRGPGCDEHSGRHRLGGNCKQDPAVDLKGVICAGDVVEAEAARDRIALAARRPQVALDHMAPE